MSIENPKLKRKDNPRKIDNSIQAKIPKSKMKHGSTDGKMSVYIPEIKAVIFTDLDEQTVRSKYVNRGLNFMSTGKGKGGRMVERMEVEL